ncbi:FAD-dependent oxidoreductase [Erythrobacter sp. EhN03]|uniref:NAD(P)/FAD-dependent oxidoreductase n=1 Tax=Qipengyuania flava TaxID=192812 RepID=UPI0007F410A9|nr:FAD-dependent oxidoreductase [Qipengyuania flava]ASP30951.1 FAD-binding oxidoreductase [Qipengyuania flava]MEC7624199.1 FAD-dependent oxidoreductase [Pseudomonadota bacterium]OAN86627.1 FAD-dependent oxidoreductase [Erythrobacter sp. EhN03]
MTHDFAIVGAGIAGASLAAELAESGASVLILEGEDKPGYHATGRSAAFWEECYGGPEIVPLTLASGEYLRENGFLHQRGALYIAREGDEELVTDFMQRFVPTGATIQHLGRGDLQKRLPGVRHEWSDAIWEPVCADIDVAGLHAHYLARARSAGALLECRARVCEMNRASGSWTIATETGASHRAKTVVNAAGAWADELAVMAGANPVGIKPYRRTVAQVRIDPPVSNDLPLVLDLRGRFYFKPESGRLWLSPHDEEPSVACDAAPEELAVAEAIARLEEVVDWKVAAVEHKWAGLRSFAPDRRPVYGHDPQVEGFAWFAGQGGFGIQTSPAAARLGRQLLLDEPRDAMTQGLDTGLYAPGRFG